MALSRNVLILLRRLITWRSQNLKKYPVTRMHKNILNADNTEAITYLDIMSAHPGELT